MTALMMPVTRTMAPEPAAEIGGRLMIAAFKHRRCPDACRSVGHHHAGLADEQGNQECPAPTPVRPP